MSEKLPQRPESNEFKASGFLDNLSKLKFDEKALKDEMYKVLSNPRGYSLVKGEIVNKVDASMSSINVWDLDAYIEESGGEDFLKEIYNRGVAGLKKDFEKQKQKLKKNIAVLQSDRKDFSTKSFQDSKLAENIRRVAEASSVDVKDLTFEQAFNHNLFGNYLRPTMQGVAEYGLTWLEYKNRASRKAILKRKEQEALISKQDVEEAAKSNKGTYKEDPKGPEAKVEVPKSTPKPKVEASEEGLTLKFAKELLVGVAKPYIEEFIAKKYPASKLQIEFVNNGTTLRVMDGDNYVASISAVKDSIGHYGFQCNQRIFVDLDKALPESEGQIRRYMENKKYREEIRKEDQDARDKKEKEEWFELAMDFILSINGVDSISVMKDSHGYTKFPYGTVKTNVVVSINKSHFYGELDFNKKAIVFRTPLVISDPVNGRGLNAIHQFKPISLGDMQNRDKLVEEVKKLPEAFKEAEEKSVKDFNSNPL